MKLVRRTHPLPFLATALTTSLTLFATLISGCSSTSSATTTPDASIDSTTDASTVDASSACSDLWANLTATYPTATAAGSCDGVAAASAIVGSLMNLDGLTIDNNGATMTPCVQAKCDSSYVYVASNALPHYDFVQTTPNALSAVNMIFRVPITPTPITASSGTATEVSTLTGCTAAYASYAASASASTSNEPSGICGTGTYLVDTLSGGTKEYAESISCLGTTGFMIDGVPTYGPNEAQTPDPYGNPSYYWPALASDSYIAAGYASAALDLCGGHTSPASMHYHAATDPCFARDSSGKPANSYVAATEGWDYAAMLNDACTTESGIVGWSYDGYPIKGPCVCTARNTDGTCKTVKRARSGWVYDGLNAWGDGATTPSDLTAEGSTCTATSDCCPETGTCKYKCTYAVFDDTSAAGGTTADKRCVLLDYSYCANRFVDRTTQDVSAVNFVYMDRCNGFEGPDGYSYYATMSFPFLTGCFHGAPATTSASAGGGGGMTGGGGDATGAPPACDAGQTSMCCGDGTCSGPETSANCPADCK